MNRNFVPAALALALVLPFAASVASAQAATDPAMQNQVQGSSMRHTPDPHRQAMKLSRKLNLTPDQTAKVEPILAERMQKMQAVKANASLSPDQMHQQLHAIGKNTHEELKSVLTPEQMQQMRSMHHEHGSQQQPAGSTPTGV